jgi:hypothetical protein
MTDSVLILGDRRDTHLIAVTDALAAIDGPQPTVIDAPSLRHTPYRLETNELTVGPDTVRLGSGTRGWLRRTAPTLWGAGTVSGSLDSVQYRAFLTLVGSISRLGSTSWLTSLEAMLRAEDRLLQLDVVDGLGYRVPRTVVTSSGEVARESLGDEFVVKPLAAGFFNTATGPRAVFSEAVTASELSEVDFADAPFVAQELIEARTHLRVVTVGRRAWVASLEAADRPLDWRRQGEAHASWAQADDPEVAKAASSVAAELQVGFTSQDWIRDEQDGPVFIDLNPGGQWLFLPSEVSRPATQAIAAFLAGGPW